MRSAHEGLVTVDSPPVQRSAAVPDPGPAETEPDETHPEARDPEATAADSGEPESRDAKSSDAESGDVESSDAELLAAHVDGDPDAFATLFTRHQGRLWAVALRVMGRPDDAADVLQDAAISAFRRAGTFRGEAQVTTWLHRIVVNAALDRIRRMKVRATEALPEDADRVLAAPEAADPLVQAEESDRVLRALAQLDPDRRAAVVLVVMQGYSVDEAARILGCAPGTVKSRCARGRAQLLPLLRTEPED